jgi:hypothetical protein
MNFDFQQLFILLFLVCHNIVKINNIDQHTKFHDPSLPGESFASTSKVVRSAYFGIVKGTGFEIMASMLPSTV